MAENINRFGFLMTLFGIPGKELADKLKVDTSLVSRWKSGERKLTLSSEYIDTIAGFFMKKAFPPKDRQLYALLKNYDKSFNTSAGNGAVRAVLCRFLCDYDTPLLDKKKQQSLFYTNPFKTETTVYQGKDGKRKAIYDLFSFSQTLDKKHDIYICDWEDTDWRNGDPSFMSNFEQCIIESIVHGHTIKILQDFSLNRARVVNNIKFWLPLFMTGGVQIYDAPTQKESDVRRAIYLIDDEMVLNSVSIDGEKDNNHIVVADDPRSVALGEHCMKRYIGKKLPVMNSIPANRIDIMANELLLRSDKPKESFLATAIPMMTDLPIGILKEVLITNGIGNEKAAPVLTACDNLRTVFERDMHYYNFTQLLDLDLLQRAISQPYYIDYELSTAFQKEIRISRKQLKETLACMKSKLEKRAKYNIVITPMRKVDTDDLPVQFYIRASDCMLSWDMIKMPFAAFSTEPVVAEHFMDSMTELQARIPAEHQTKEWAIKKLSELISTAAAHRP